MNTSLILLELGVIGLGLAIILIDLWTPADRKQRLGYFAAAGVGFLLLASLFWQPVGPSFGFANTLVVDPLAMYFKRFSLLAAFFVLLMATDFADRIPVAIAEFYALVLFALAGMLFAASANDFVMVFVSLELITVTFYILTSFQRSRPKSLEAGVKYLVLGALSTGFTLFGIALVYGTAQTTNFTEIAAKAGIVSSPLFLLGLFLIVAGLGFKIAAFPFQIWAPDVYQGSPAPITAFLAVGSKAAGFVLLLRVLFAAAPNVAEAWKSVLTVMTIVTILYGNLCAIPQRNLKRLLGYSSISNAGYLLLGITAANAAGASAILFYLLGYLFAVIAAFLVISIVSRQSDDEDISMLAGLYRRSPWLAHSLALAMISLAGIPPLAGFFGKFLLLKSVVETGVSAPLNLALLGAALFGIVVSFYYYLGVVRAIYWSKEVPDDSPIPVPNLMKVALGGCVAGLLFLGIFPAPAFNASNRAAASLPAAKPSANLAVTVPATLP